MTLRALSLAWQPALRQLLHKVRYSTSANSRLHTRHWLLWFVLAALTGCLTGLAQAQGLPPEVDSALARAKLPRDSVSVFLVDAQGTAAPRISHRAEVGMNPASVMKLVTTYSALELLGPSYSWSTPVFVDGTVRDGTLTGNLRIQGQGDPTLVLERLWLLLRRVQSLGIRTIAGDIVLDRSAFEVPPADPASFDGEPLKPYNAAPDALLINFKAVVMTFTPEVSNGVARVQFDPPLAGVQMQTTVPLVTGECGDYRGALKADFADAMRVRFAGGYPQSCAEKVWAVAYADPKNYAARAVQGLWQEMGGKLQGTVRMANAAEIKNASARPTFDVRSPPLAEIIRDINKYSNNVMAQQVYLSLGRLQASAGPVAAAAESAMTPGSFEASRKVVQRWWTQHWGPSELPVLDNGSGLSRSERISTHALGQLLQTAYASAWMPELMASLPISSIDGTLSRMKTHTSGSAHLKTGSLDDVMAVAGYVNAAGGKRYVLVAIVNHANARSARPVFEALVDYATKLN